MRVRDVAVLEERGARIQATPCGGIGLIHEMVRSIGLAQGIDCRMDVFKRHFQARQ